MKSFLNKEDKTYSKNKLIKYNEEKYKSSNSEILRKIISVGMIILLITINFQV